MECAIWTHACTYWAVVRMRVRHTKQLAAGNWQLAALRTQSAKGKAHGEPLTVKMLRPACSTIPLGRPARGAAGRAAATPPRVGADAELGPGTASRRSLWRRREDTAVIWHARYAAPQGLHSLESGRATGAATGDPRGLIVRPNHPRRSRGCRSAFRGKLGGGLSTPIPRVSLVQHRSR